MAAEVGIMAAAGGHLVLVDSQELVCVMVSTVVISDVAEALATRVVLTVHRTLEILKTTATLANKLPITTEHSATRIALLETERAALVPL